MRSKKSALASVLLFMALGSSVGCTGEPGPLIDPMTGKPFTEKDLRNAKLMFGLSDPTQKELNEAYTRMRQMRGGSGNVHPNALDAQDD